MWAVGRYVQETVTVADLKPGDLFVPMGRDGRAISTHFSRLRETAGSRYDGHRMLISSGGRWQAPQDRLVIRAVRPIKRSA